jgi:hypothetical protein
MKPLKHPHSAYWAFCPDCDQRVLELVEQGATQSDAQAVAEAEHRKANRPFYTGQQALPLT